MLGSSKGSLRDMGWWGSFRSRILGVLSGVLR